MRSLVLPAFNEASRVGATIEAVRRTMGAIEIVVVDDGSNDDTAAAARVAGADVVIDAVHRGKGAAVRAGMRAATGNLVAFTDADGAYDSEQLDAVFAAVAASADVAIGRRETSLATIRGLGSRGVNLATKAVLLGRYGDTQCGLKAFRAPAAREVFERATVNGFAFDIEILMLAERAGLRIVEVPVAASGSVTSSVHALRDGPRLLLDIVRLARKRPFWGM